MVSMLVRRAYQEACHIASDRHATGRIFPFGRQVVQDLKKPCMNSAGFAFCFLPCLVDLLAGLGLGLPILGLPNQFTMDWLTNFVGL